MNTEKTQHYTSADYMKLHRHVLDYQKNIPGAAEAIIESFNDYLWKYVNFLTSGHFKIKDISLRRFISLYMRDKENIKSPTTMVNQYKFKGYVREYMFETAQRVHRMFSIYSQKELRDELICALLSMAKKYKDYEKPSFHNYVDKCFHFEAFRALQPLVNDPVMRFDNEELIDQEIEDKGAELQYEVALEKATYQERIKKSTIPIVQNHKISVYDNNSLNINWVNGVTCSEMFKTLTPFEREILILSFVQKTTDEEIAKQYGFCRATINRKKQAAIKKLRCVNSDIGE